MKRGPECKSYNPKGMVCHDGFVQRAFCWGVVGCFHCGHVTQGELPACLKDEVPAHLSRDDGSPLLYRAALHESEKDEQR